MRKIISLVLVWTLPCVLSAQTSQTPSTSQSQLIPKISSEGPMLQFDFPSLHIGTAEYDEGPTGATVFYFPKGAAAAVDVRGGAPGTTNTDWLQLGYNDLGLDAICFAGGSWYGLEAASGVRAELLASKHKNPLEEVANVAGAIVYDFPGRANTVYADKELGRAASTSASPRRWRTFRSAVGKIVS